jgi:hypothetical protein
MRTATGRQRFVVRADEKLTAFLKLESTAGRAVDIEANPKQLSHE